MKPAVFLDRDGVLNDPVLDPVDGLPESPLHMADVVLCKGVAAPVIALKAAGFEPVVVTNQPAAAKGKTSITQLHAINGQIRELLAAQGADMPTWKICLHHPDGTVPELAAACECRKPAPGMLLEAASELGLDLANSWMVGDSDADVEAGRAAGCRTVLIENPLTSHRRSPGIAADATAIDLQGAAAIILDSESV